nr:hypothetical protein BgiMline_028591 [Biomphalaria glabrata]
MVPQCQILPPGRRLGVRLPVSQVKIAPFFNISIDLVLFVTQEFSFELKAINTGIEYDLYFYFRNDAIRLKSNSQGILGQVQDLQLNPGTIQLNSTTNIHILVTSTGYRIYIDRSFCCLYDRNVPYSGSNYLRFSGFVQPLKIFV